MTNEQPLLIAVMGPTASGKTPVAEALADKLDARLINFDAFQVYRKLDIGTAKPIDKGRYRLLDVIEPNEPFGLGEWLKLADREIARSYVTGENVILVGGTGLYIRALFEQYTGMAGLPEPALRQRLNATPIEELRLRLAKEAPAVAAATDMANPVRVRRALERLESPPLPAISLPPFRRIKLALDVGVPELDQRIARRIAEMMHNGWIQEIEGLRRYGFHKTDPGLRAIGYRTLWDHLEGKIGLEEAITTTIVETRRYAKRQRTWLRTEPGIVELSATNEVDTIRKAMERIRDVLM
jgi:tRNA dimethylallyltransferase